MGRGRIKLGKGSKRRKSGSTEKKKRGWESTNYRRAECSEKGVKRGK